jgi:hypothetical protein
MTLTVIEAQRMKLESALARNRENGGGIESAAEENDSFLGRSYISPLALTWGRRPLPISRLGSSVPFVVATWVRDAQPELPIPYRERY